ncbi:MAG: hypothetical protein JW786_09670 [Desulfobacterales bacterium]|nr:hypothetical protein [Desulfobacterales bacterium]
MLSIPPALMRSYDLLLNRKGINNNHQPHYKKWLRYYLDFCNKYEYNPKDIRSFPAFNDKLKNKKQPESLRKQAYFTVSLYYEITTSDCDA